MQMESTPMPPHNALDTYSQHEQPSYPPSKRRKRDSGAKRGAVYGGTTVRMCPHCGRTFKRTEHLERHIRTHTKEKPYTCRCGEAFARRDLLVRHQRIQSHDDDTLPSESPTADADLAAAVSLSGLSAADPWMNDQLQQVNIGASTEGTDIERQAYSQNILPPQHFNSSSPPPLPMGIPSGDNVIFDPHFAEFANFLDGVGLPAVWSPYFNGPYDKDDEAVDVGPGHPTDRTPSPRQANKQRAGTPFSSWLPSAPTGNRLPNHSSESHPRAIDPEVQRFRVTDEEMAKLHASLEAFSDVLDDNFKFPSRHALTRYITSWFEGFHSHMPFLHCRTWRILNHPLETVLGFAAVGAQYCFEHRASNRLFRAGKAIVLDRLANSLVSGSLVASSKSSNPRVGPRAQSRDHIETVRALIALMGYATWEPNASLVKEAFELQTCLTHVLREIGLEDEVETDPTPSGLTQPGALHAAWLAWVDRESRRRSKLIAFSFLHTHSIAYNVYPVLRSNEVKLRLPCSTKEWKAATAAQWQAAAAEVKKQQLFFQDALSLLLRNDNTAPLDPIPTPLGNYVLLHGLLQRIHIVRDLSLPVMSDSAALPCEEVEKLERGLRSWTSGWQQAAESSLDPNNENGPIPFTSSSLLALAYVRIHLHLGPYRQLETRDSVRIARAIGRSPRVERGDGIIAALLYAVHMLSIPVRLGVDRVARSQAFFWSVRHSLSSLECGVLLSKWLCALGESIASVPLTDSENRIVHWVRSIVEEAFAVVDFEDEDEGLADFRDARNLGLAVLRIWAHFFKSNTQWPFINIIGAGLERYREILIHSQR